MKRQDTLIRLRRFRVDDFKRRMATLDGMKADVEKKLADLEESVARERQRAGESDIGRLAFPSFLRSIEDRRENLRATHKDIERERVQCQADLTTAYQDLKSLEFANEQQEKRLAEIEARRAQSRLDEMALVRHLRKHAFRGA
jgi:flagellar export protein FliJ